MNVVNKVSLKAWGNSQGIRISKEVLQALDLSLKQEVEFELYVEDQKIILKPIKKSSRLQQIFDDFEEDYDAEHARYDWGDEGSVGREVF